MWQKMLLAYSELFLVPGSHLRECYTEYQLDLLRHATSTPLTILSVCLDEMSKNSKLKHIASLHTAMRSAQSLESTLLSLHKKQQIQNNCDIAALLRSICSWCSTPEHPVYLSIVPKKQSIYIHQVNAARIQEALLCLVKNAVEASSEKRKSVYVVILDECDEITVIIKDKGPGFPFWQLWLAKMPYISFKGIGRGMGLYFAHTHIEQELGGKVLSHSSKNTGTLFECQIPKHRQSYSHNPA